MELYPSLCQGNFPLQGGNLFITKISVTGGHYNKRNYSPRAGELPCMSCTVSCYLELPMASTDHPMLLDNALHALLRLENSYVALPLQHHCRRSRNSFTRRHRSISGICQSQEHAVAACWHALGSDSDSTLSADCATLLSRRRQKLITSHSQNKTALVMQIGGRCVF